MLSIVSLPGVAARNATSKLTDPADVRAVLRLESEARNRVIVTDAARSRLRALGATEAGAASPVPAVAVEDVAAPVEPPAVVVELQAAPVAPTEPDDTASATCSRCRVTGNVSALFGFRAMTTKAGIKIRRQSQCKKCRGLKPLVPRAVVVADAAKAAPL